MDYPETADETRENDAPAASRLQLCDLPIERNWRSGGLSKVVHRFTGASICDAASGDAQARIIACLNVFDGVPTDRIEALGAAIRTMMIAETNSAIGVNFAENGYGPGDMLTAASIVARSAGFARGDALTPEQFDAALAIAEGAA